VTGRTPCSVPNCRRTRPADSRYDEWVCGPHWREVPKVERRTYSALKRKGWDDTAADQWQRCKGLAVAAAAGL
jgi:hypothetical protein